MFLRWIISYQKKEGTMLFRFLTFVLFLLVLTLTSCMNERRTTYEITFIVEKDSLVQVEKDSLKFEKDSISLLMQGKKQKIKGNVLDISASSILSNEQPTNSMLHYCVYSAQNKVLAELYASDNDGEGSFDSFTATGDVKLISENIGESWTTIQNKINEDINSLRHKGKKKIVDTSTGKEIKKED